MYSPPEQTIPVITLDGNKSVGKIPKDCIESADFLLKRENRDIREELAYSLDPEFINAILELIQEGYIYDFNYDGKINCIDYSLIFRKLYGNHAHLIINKNPNTGMNHMFIRIHGIKYLYLEPQGRPDYYSMGIVWGDMYDPSYNKDVTDIWGMQY